MKKYSDNASVSAIFALFRKLFDKEVSMQQGKRAIVIGASSGIGQEVAKLLMEQGWSVGVAARRVVLLQTIDSKMVMAQI